MSMNTYISGSLAGLNRDVVGEGPAYCRRGNRKIRLDSAVPETPERGWGTPAGNDPDSMGHHKATKARNSVRRSYMSIPYIYPIGLLVRLVKPGESQEGRRSTKEIPGNRFHRILWQFGRWLTTRSTKYNTMLTLESLNRRSGCRKRQHRNVNFLNAKAGEIAQGN
ncbi:hypothetical protein SODALDRAFT_395905 [Sodiomyces alkalinus F11]|uniref:Uncharacterized protein n=1 Tax=Sodiomyces alkalinus (strain CBS 110278 / VKM F-3762 / F11) TaxID=1314773 RepID=A0A3N2Q0Y2_SODAK|nr:hypothetical protein SODALDRAFT_395905 [Sodiomyces alkalinus F11]ROT40419.1 hypothetical protein SODALDRAFT_395905 [Sodiomyces alkalinus F11]